MLHGLVFSKPILAILRVKSKDNVTEMRYSDFDSRDKV